MKSVVDSPKSLHVTTSLSHDSPFGYVCRYIHVVNSMGICDINTCKSAREVHHGNVEIDAEFVGSIFIHNHRDIFGDGQILVKLGEEEESHDQSGYDGNESCRHSGIREILVDLSEEMR